MMALARRKVISVDDLRDVPGLGLWRRKTYGAEIVKVLRNR